MFLRVVIALLFFVASIHSKRALYDEYLQMFDMLCLTNMLSDPNAKAALQSLKDVKIADNGALINLGALELSDHVECITATSKVCGNQVKVFPPRDQISSQVSTITSEISQMSDTQVLKSLNVDIDGLCTSMMQMENALSPYQACLEKNVNALAAIPQNIKSAVLGFLELTNPTGSSAFNFDLGSALALSAGCDAFQHQVANALRSQIASDFWTTLLTDALSNYDLTSFDDKVNSDLNANMGNLDTCVIPIDLICIQHEANYSSTCQLASQQDFDFTSNIPISGTGKGSNYLNSFQEFSSTTDQYPCSDVFADSCYGSYLNIPNLDLTTNCLSLSSLSPSNPDDGNNGDGNGDGSNGGDDNGGDNGNNGGDNGGDNGGNDNSQNGDVDVNHPSPTDLNDPLKDGLSSGTVAVIVIVVLGVAIAVAGTVFILYRRGYIPIHRDYQVQLE